ncbi:hypothetical protein AB0H73_36415 [Streptomyces olivoreticuli]
MFMLRTPKDDGGSGLTVTEAQQPLLWSTPGCSDGGCISAYP